MKTKTQAEIDEKKAKEAARLRKWRRDNPEKQQAILDRFWAKKVAAMQGSYSADLGKIQAELKE